MRKAGANIQDRHVYHNKQLVSADEKQVTELAETQKVYRRPCASIDVYSGPVLCAHIEERPGYVLTAETPDPATAEKHPFIHFRQYDASSAENIQALLAFSESFKQFVQRLLQRGYDLAGSMRSNTRQPVGRCWRVFHREHHIGAIWDYPGQFCNLSWQPLQSEAGHSEITMTVYVSDEHDPLYLQCWKLFAGAHTIGELRLSMEGKGFRLEPCLYNPY